MSGAAKDAQGVSLDHIEQIESVLSRAGEDLDQLAILEALKDAVIHKIDSRVALVAEELWARAKQAMNQLQCQQKETTNKLLDEVARCRERQHALEVENNKLKQGIQSLAARFSFVGQVFSGKDMELAGSPSSVCPVEGCTAPVSTPVSQSVLSPEASDFFAQASPFMPGGGEATGTDCLWGAAKFPEVPPFPFPVQPPMSPATPLSLAEALSTDNQPQHQQQQHPQQQQPQQQQAPLSIADALTAAPSVAQDQAARLDSWNGQWATGCTFAMGGSTPATEDEATGLTNERQTTASKEVQDCIAVARSDVPVPSTPITPGGKSTTLRAEASVFVPKSVESTPQRQQDDSPSD
jgi:hypothetical protein